MFMQRIFAGLLLLAFSALGWGANVTISANANLTFTPKNVVINAGDSVTFKNVGGGFHNVVADNGSFQCANGCNNVNGGNGSPSASNWQFTVNFPNPGTVGYHCEVHGSAGSGMFGSIMINAVVAPPSIALGGYLSGNWYNPAQSGHGFELEFTSQPSSTSGQNTVVAYWYVYTPDGTGQTWLYSQGSYDTTKNTVTLPVLLLDGAKFPPLFNSSDIQQTNWGTLTFTFADCNNGTASWSSSVPGYNSGSLPITRLTNVAGTSCPQ